MAATDHGEDLCNKIAASFNGTVNSEYSFQLFLVVKHLLWNVAPVIKSDYLWKNSFI